MVEAVIVICLIVAIGFFYFIPSLEARRRRVSHRDAIFVLNLLLGWSLLGWVAALIWAMTDHTTEGVATTERRSACPLCSEAILSTARVCRYCGSVLPPGWADRPQT